MSTDESTTDRDTPTSPPVHVGNPERRSERRIPAPASTIEPSDASHPGITPTFRRPGRNPTPEKGGLSTGLDAMLPGAAGVQRHNRYARKISPGFRQPLPPVQFRATLTVEPKSPASNPASVYPIDTGVFLGTSVDVTL